jgi:hypothetical protein
MGNVRVEKRKKDSQIELIIGHRPQVPVAQRPFLHLLATAFSSDLHPFSKADQYAEHIPSKSGIANLDAAAVKLRSSWASSS